jgi:stage II sporulation protein D
VTVEDPRTSAAVRATRRTVLTYDGSVITALFFSTSGGQTENVENIFGQSPPRPYLVSVPDPYDNLSPYHAWPDRPTFSAARLGQLLGLGAPVASVQVLARGVSPRVTRLRATAVDGRSAVLAGTEVRRRLGLRDTWFDVRTTLAPAAR